MNETVHTFGCFAPDCPERKRGGVIVSVRVEGQRRALPMVVCPYCRTVMTARGRDFYGGPDAA